MRPWSDLPPGRSSRPTIRAALKQGRPSPPLVGSARTSSQGPDHPTVDNDGEGLAGVVVTPGEHR